MYIYVYATTLYTEHFNNPPYIEGIHRIIVEIKILKHYLILSISNRNIVL